jgi:SH3-like domain-containing protein
MLNWKKIFVTTLGTLSVLGTTVFAATGVVNAPSGLVLRETASKGGNPLATVPDKAQVEIVEEDGEWYKAKVNEQTGYLFAEFVNKTETTEKPSEPTTEQTSTEQTTEENQGQTKTQNKIKVYNMPLITSTVVNEVEPNVEIKIEKQITNWSYITAGEVKGWVRTYGIQNKIKTSTVEEPKTEEPQKPDVVEEPSQPTVTEPEKPAEPETPAENKPADNSSSTETTVGNVKGFVAVDYANMRKQPSTDSEIVTTLTKDTSFTITAETEEWYKVKFTSIDDVVYEGYIFKNLVTKANT